MTAETCTDCNHPATTDAYAGWRCIGGRWLMETRPMCDFHAGEDVRARAEARSS